LLQGERRIDDDVGAWVVEALVGVDVILLDNMTPDEARECVALVRGSAVPTVVVEVSGGVTLENVRAYADAGADAISTSVITQSAPALDIAFDIAPDTALAEEH
jgi:nicotinate-nucleotide pyrophosphorylase (carboxylating)